MDIKIIVATHKTYWMPDDDVYMPLHVGRAGKAPLGYSGDDTGDHISEKNPSYCELTGLYWAWKNLNCAYIGLCHYRRYFGRRPENGTEAARRAAVFQRRDYEALLRQYDVILPKKRSYYIETVRSQYEHGHNKKDLDEAERVIEALCPAYSAAFAAVMGRTRLYILNMFVMKKSLFDAYCRWLFPLLFALEARIDRSGYDPYQARVFGFLSERLFNVWLEKQALHVKEVPVVYLEKQNWPKKIYRFLKRKFA